MFTNGPSNVSDSILKSLGVNPNSAFMNGLQPKRIYTEADGRIGSATVSGMSGNTLDINAGINPAGDAKMIMDMANRRNQFGPESINSSPTQPTTKITKTHIVTNIGKWTTPESESYDVGAFMFSVLPEGDGTVRAATLEQVNSILRDHQDIYNTRMRQQRAMARSDAITGRKRGRTAELDPLSEDFSGGAEFGMVGDVIIHDEASFMRNVRFIGVCLQQQHDVSPMMQLPGRTGVRYMTTCTRGRVDNITNMWSTVALKNGDWVGFELTRVGTGGMDENQEFDVINASSPLQLVPRVWSHRPVSRYMSSGAPTDRRIEILTNFYATGEGGDGTTAGITLDVVRNQSLPSDFGPHDQTNLLFDYVQARESAYDNDSDSSYFSASLIDNRNSQKYKSTNARRGGGGGGELKYYSVPTFNTACVFPIGVIQEVSFAPDRNITGQRALAAIYEDATGCARSQCRNKVALHILDRHTPCPAFKRHDVFNNGNDHMVIAAI